MFQDYLKRLEADKRCQNLSMTSFLLLPMQRITRLPLLILAILNRTPMDNPNHPIVEKSLRAVQKVWRMSSSITVHVIYLIYTCVLCFHTEANF